MRMGCLTMLSYLSSLTMTAKTSPKLASKFRRTRIRLPILKNSGSQSLVGKVTPQHAVDAFAASKCNIFRTINFLMIICVEYALCTNYAILVISFSASRGPSPSRVRLWLAWAQSSGLRFIKPELLKAGPKPRLPGQAGPSHH